MSHERSHPRRRFLAGSGSLLAAGMTAPALAQSQPDYRVAVIGHTGRGNYGHGLERLWRDVPRTQLVALADADPTGLTATLKRLDGVRGFADYRTMLDRVRPDLVAEIGFTEWTKAGRLRHPRFLGLRRDKAAEDVTREEPKT